MPKHTDQGFERLTGLKSVAAEVWNAQNGIMISHGVGFAARRAYERASREYLPDGSFTYIHAGEGSSKNLDKSRVLSCGLNVAALNVIAALNDWDDRSREIVHVTPTSDKLSEWLGTFRLNEYGARERGYLAPSFATEPSILGLPNRPNIMIEDITIHTRQVDTSAVTHTTLSFNKGNVLVGIEQDGLLVDRGPRGEVSRTDAGVLEHPAYESVAGLLKHLESRVRHEISR